MTVGDPLAQIHMQVMWNRLISVVEEQAQALLRTAFGSVAREAGDLSAGVYDLKGRMLAQAVTGTPGHVNTMAVAVQHFIDRFPLADMKEGDVYTTNDPWLGTGHLFDFVMVTPAFLDGRLVALLASTCHLVDVGGRGFTADARSIYEEGIFIPHMRLFDQGRLNEPLMDLIANNVREPIEVKGDLLALVSCNDTGCRRLVGMMGEFNLLTIDDLADHILVNSRKAMIEAIRRVPNGIYDAQMTLDGYEEPVRLKLRMTVEDERIVLDYGGSSLASGYGINSPKCYSDAYSIFGLKCIIGPEIPNNAGSLGPMIVEADAGSIVHPQRPSPVTARHVVGQMLPDIVFGCLDQAIEGGVQAESAGSIWVLAASGGARVGNTEGRFNTMSVCVGGVGARPTKNGLNSTAFPSGVGAIPVEVTEAGSPLVFRRRELLPDSAGPGKYRGGFAQVVEVESRAGLPFTVSAATFDRLQNPARGRHGGKPGSPGAFGLVGGEVFHTKAVHTVPPGDRLRAQLPGGGGFGDPFARDAHEVADEVKAGLVSVAAARASYGVVVTEDGEIDATGTQALRGGQS
ncbi:MAG: hydantoinase B/oxoprolinase family protein [Proteobacteria bacterium]|nr:hydantoinase B/oxoprolinase family protein [Pseudomonadota bacterium]MDA1057398.1 hydantoinase B/oxoprolinase family protein [Pseudomonadota bacterium]